MSRFVPKLFSVHDFIKNDEHEKKQLPLTFAFMSGRRKKDYKKVFKALKRLLPSSPTVKGIVADFEAGIWLAFRRVYPGVPIHGCAFHLGQALWRKLKELGLRTTYIQEKSVHQFCRKVVALPFLTAEHIAPAFARLKDQSKMIPLLYSWGDYVESTWITNIIFPVDSWSVFRKSVRTNTDVEGWHRRVNAKAGKANLPFYVLVSLLYDKATSFVTQIQLVLEKS